MRFHIPIAAILLLATTTTTAAAQRYSEPPYYSEPRYDDRRHHTATEAQLGSVMGGGWIDASAGATQSPDVTVGGTARLGFAIALQDSVGLVLALHGDLLSIGDSHERFLVADAAGLLGLRFHISEDDRSSFLLGGLVGLARSDQATLQKGGGFTYAGVLGCRLDHLFLEARYQIFTFDVGPVDVAIRQVLLTAGFAL